MTRAELQNLIRAGSFAANLCGSLARCADNGNRKCISPQDAAPLAIAERAWKDAMRAYAGRALGRKVQS